MFAVDPGELESTLRSLDRARTQRNPARVESSLEALRAAARSGHNLVEPSIDCALARVTTGEWADALREVFGEYRPHTGVEGQSLRLGNRGSELRSRVDAHVRATGHRPRMVVAKPGLDGHSNGAEVIALAARDAGFEVIYSGIRLTPAEIVRTAVEESADVIGVSILSGSHLELVGQIMDCLADSDAADIAVVVGGIIPARDVAALMARGVRAVFTPSDFELAQIIGRLVDVLEGARERLAP
jgi:(2R)-ethylmalonyl-CoA mutase